MQWEMAFAQRFIWLLAQCQCPLGGLCPGSLLACFILSWQAIWLKENLRGPPRSGLWVVVNLIFRPRPMIFSLIQIGFSTSLINFLAIWWVILRRLLWMNAMKLYCLAILWNCSIPWLIYTTGHHTYGLTGHNARLAHHNMSSKRTLRLCPLIDEIHILVTSSPVISRQDAAKHGIRRSPHHH